jgi:hypothetical protein
MRVAKKSRSLPSATAAAPPSSSARGSRSRRYPLDPTPANLPYDADGNVVELRCAYDPASRGGNAPDGRKVKATLHWVGRDARPADGGRRADEPDVRQHERRLDLVLRDGLDVELIHAAISTCE